MLLDENRKALIILTSTKSATRIGNPEQVIIYDHWVVAALVKKWKENASMSLFTAVAKQLLEKI